MSPTRSCSLVLAEASPTVTMRMSAVSGAGLEVS